MALRFLDVEIDPSAEMVRRGGEHYRLRQKTFHVLLYLIEHRDRVVTRDELFSVVWNGMAVSDDALVQSIVEIRKALGDDLRAPRFVRTLPKRGYHFVATASGENDRESTFTVEVETTQSIEYDAVEDVEPRPRPWLHAGAIAAALAAAVSLAALTVWKRNGAWRENRPSEVLLSGGLTMEVVWQRCGEASRRRLFSIFTTHSASARHSGTSIR